MLDKIKNKHLLIDGDIVKYRCAAVAEKTKYCVTWNNTEVEFFDTHKDSKARAEYLGDGIIWSRKEIQPLEFALQACKTTLDALLAKLNPSKTSIFLSPDRTFRHDIARTKPYKGNRVQPKPKYLKDVEEYLIKVHGATVGINIEADDAIGAALSTESDGAVSVSIDKDLLQISGWHYNWVDDRIQWISPKDADLRFYSQLLTGDVTDNIPGLPSYGPAAAKRILKGVVSRVDAATRVWSNYRSQFVDTNKDRESQELAVHQARKYFLEQAALLWILREDSYSEVNGGYVPPIKLE